MSGPKRWLQNLLTTVAGVALATTFLTPGDAEAKKASSKTSSKVTKTTSKSPKKKASTPDLITPEEKQLIREAYEREELLVDSAVRLGVAMAISDSLYPNKSFSHVLSFHLNGLDKLGGHYAYGDPKAAQTVNPTLNKLAQVWVKHLPFMTNYTEGVRQDMGVPAPESALWAAEQAAKKKLEAIEQLEKTLRERHVTAKEAIASVTDPVKDRHEVAKAAISSVSDSEPSQTDKGRVQTKVSEGTPEKIAGTAPPSQEKPKPPAPKSEVYRYY